MSSYNFNPLVAAKWATAVIAAQWVLAPQPLRVLLGLMAMDYMTGMGAAFVLKRVSSEAGWRGLVKKALTVSLILLAHVVEKAFGFELGLENILALAYCANEAISIVENAAAAGVPVPSQLVAALAGVKSLRAATPEQLRDLQGEK